MMPYFDKFMKRDSVDIKKSKAKGEMGTKKSKLFDKYNIGDVLGEGANAVVKLLIPKQRKSASQKKDKFLAIKIFKERKNWPTAQQEASILRGLSHDSIIDFKGLHKDEGQLYLILEYFDGPNLANIIYKRKGEGFDERIVSKIIKQLVDGLFYCHQRGVYHLDLKPENILCDADWNVKLIDFAFSEKTIDNRKIRRYCGTPSYMCPEMLKKEGFYPDRADVWAVGVLAYRLYTGQAPFKGNNSKEILQAITEFTIDKALLKSCTHDLRDFITKTMRRCQFKRTAIKDLVNHPFLSYHKSCADTKNLLLRSPPTICSQARTNNTLSN